MTHYPDVIEAEWVELPLERSKLLITCPNCGEDACPVFRDCLHCAKPLRPISFIEQVIRLFS